MTGFSATKKAGSVTEPCPVVEKNWVDLEYTYADGTGVPNVGFTLFDVLTDEIVAKGNLDFEGTAHVELSEAVKQVRVQFHDDPEDVGILKRSDPVPPNEHEIDWFDRMASSLNDAWESTKDGANWTWEVLQGDFKEDASVSQIITNAVITAIPVVDQVADVRDIIAALKQLVWDKRYNEGLVWFALFVTVIGLIPTVGSVLKGVIKLIWKGAKLDNLLKLFNYFMKGNGIKWLKKFKATELTKYTNDAKEIAHDIFNAISNKLYELNKKVPQSLVKIKQSIQDVLDTLRNVKSQINGQFDNVANDLRSKLGKVLEESLQTNTGAVKNTIKVEQAASDTTKSMTPDSIMAGPNKMSDEATDKASDIAKQSDDSAQARRVISNFRQRLIHETEIEANQLISIGRDETKGVALSKAGIEEHDIITKSYKNIEGKVKTFPGIKRHGAKLEYFSVVDEKAFIDEISKLYWNNGERLNPIMKDFIQRFIAKKTNLLTKNGMPGLHAEVRAANSLLNKYPEIPPQNISLATFKLIPAKDLSQGKQFVACTNCGGILSAFEILTGRK